MIHYAVMSANAETDRRSHSLLAKEVLPSFIALRQAVLDASGHDFLARLSEANRAIGFGSDTSSYASWHKSQ